MYDCPNFNNAEILKMLASCFPNENNLSYDSA